MNEIKKATKGTNKKLKNSRKLKAGWFATLMVVIVLAIVIGVNVLVAQIPTTFTNFDTTEQQLFTIGEQTKQIAASLTEDITLYHIAQTGSEDTGITELLSRYAALSDHIKVQKVDPTDRPKFVSEMLSNSTENVTLSNNSVIVSSAERARGIDYYSIYVTEYANDYYYSADTVADQYFDGESQVTSAIDYVTTDDLPVLYVLTGHGEYTLSESLIKLIDDQNFELRENLSLLTEGAVPEDASCIIILSPSSDLSTDEITMLNDYIDAGGRILMYTDYQDNPLTNLFAWTQSYGAVYENGLLFDSGEGNFYKEPYYLLPNINSHDITQPLINSNYLTLTFMPHAISATKEQPEGVTMDVLLYTSANAYLKEDITEDMSIDKADGDRSGQFILGAVMHKGEGQIVWFSSSTMLDDSFNQAVSGANFDLFINSLGYLAEHEQSISIHSKSLISETFMPTKSALIGLGVGIGVILLVIITAGIVVCVKRRKK